MKSVATRRMLGAFIVIASLAVSGFASAQAQIWGRWRNASTAAGGPYYLGVSGGEVCDPATEKCGVKPGTQLITWTKSGLDQFMGAANPANNGGPGIFRDWYNDWFDGTTPMCLALPNNATTGPENTNVVIWDCDSQNNAQNWYLVPASIEGAPYPGCYLIVNQGNGMALSVYQGNVKDGARVILWPGCAPNNGECGNPSNAWHPDQFWCPDNS
jgi:Ricin-type beta-trefoil lectin domain-like